MLKPRVNMTDAELGGETCGYLKFLPIELGICSSLMHWETDMPDFCYGYGSGDRSFAFFGLFSVFLLGDARGIPAYYSPSEK